MSRPGRSHGGAGLPQPRSVKTALTEVRRAVREALGRFAFGAGEAARALAYLGADCVFCGSPARAWDLLVPRRSGGEVVLGNVVPVCLFCHGNKREQDFQAWMLQDRWPGLRARGIANVRGRLRRLRAYMTHFQYTPTSLEARLGPGGLRAFEEVHRRDWQLRTAVAQHLAVAGSGTAGREVPANTQRPRASAAPATTAPR